MTMPVQKPGRSKQNYATPSNFITAVKTRLGIKAFTHDFAADRSNRKAETYWSEKTNALSYDGLNWALACGQGWGWLNPPYSNIEPWAQQCALTKAHGGQIAFLVPASVGANWYRDWVFPFALTLALNGRLAFMPDKPTWLYPKDTMLCLFSPDIDPDFDVWSWQR